MAEGFWVAGGPAGDREYTDFYMQKRQELFGITGPGEWCIKSKGEGQVSLIDTKLGLVKTREQAEQLKDCLAARYPHLQLRVERDENPTAERLVLRYMDGHHDEDHFMAWFPSRCASAGLDPKDQRTL